MLLKGYRNQLHRDMIELNINIGLRINEDVSKIFADIFL